jgi:flagellar basal body-associated protein FliL
MEGSGKNPRIFILIVLLVGMFATAVFFIGVHTGKKQCKPEMIKLMQEKQHADSVKIRTERDMKFLMDSLNYESLNHFLLRRSIDNI